eukprot:381640-Amphidinium_carterae.1
MPEGGVIFNTLNGTCVRACVWHAFASQLQSVGTWTPAFVEVTPMHPIMSVSITETEIDVIGVQYLIGHYAAWNFFMSLKDRVQLSLAMYGNESLVNDPMEAAYIAVLLWAEAVELAGSFEIDIVRETLIGMAVGAPEGEASCQ